MPPAHLVVVGLQADGGHVDIRVRLHHHQPQLLLLPRLAARGELDHGAQGGGLALQGPRAGRGKVSQGLVKG